MLHIRSRYPYSDECQRYRCSSARASREARVRCMHPYAVNRRVKAYKLAFSGDHPHHRISLWQADLHPRSLNSITTINQGLIDRFDDISARIRRDCHACGFLAFPLMVSRLPLLPLAVFSTWSDPFVVVPSKVKRPSGVSLSSCQVHSSSHKLWVPEATSLTFCFCETKGDRVLTISP